MPAFDGRDGICGRKADRMISDPSLGRGKLYVCGFHATALSRVRRRARSSGGISVIPVATSGGIGDGTWRGAASRYKPAKKGWGEYILMTGILACAGIFASLFFFGPRIFDVVDQYASMVAHFAGS
jgi:hypothetical protein